MQKKIIAVALGAALALPASSDEHKTSAANAMIDVAEHELNAAKQNGPDWLKRVDISVDTKEDYRPIWSIETVQPFAKDSDDVWFWQGRIAHGEDDTTMNLGTGYRWLLDSNWLLGVNLFYDHQFDEDHARVGVGAEAFGEYATYRVNYYNATSGKKQTVPGTFEQALDGFDAEIETPVPYLPWARFSLKGFKWDTLQAAEDTEGYTAGFRLYPTNNFEIEVGATDDNTSKTKSFMKVTWFYDRPARVINTATEKMTSDKVFASRDVSKLMLEKVRRHNDIVVEKTVGATGITIGRRN